MTFPSDLTLTSRADALRLAAWIKSAWPRFDVSVETAAVYVDALQTLPRDVAERAVRLATMTLVHPPSVSELLACAGKVLGAVTPSAEDAWVEVRRAIGSRGRDRMPEWKHSSIAHTVDVMGWRELCESTAPHHDRAAFLRIYASIEERYRLDMVSALLEQPLLPRSREQLARVEQQALDEGKGAKA